MEGQQKRTADQARLENLEKARTAKKVKIDAPNLNETQNVLKHHDENHLHMTDVDDDLVNAHKMRDPQVWNILESHYKAIQKLSRLNKTKPDKEDVSSRFKIFQLFSAFGVCLIGAATRVGWAKYNEAANAEAKQAEHLNNTFYV